MSGIILLCRAGFEGDCAAEIQDKATELGIYGYCQTQPNQAYVTYNCQAEEAEHIAWIHAWHHEYCEKPLAMSIFNDPGFRFEPEPVNPWLLMGLHQ